MFRLLGLNVRSSTLKGYKNPIQRANNLKSNKSTLSNLNSVEKLKNEREIILQYRSYSQQQDKHNVNPSEEETNEKTTTRVPVGWQGALIVLGLAGVVAFIFKQKSDEKQKAWRQKQIASAGKPSLGGPFTLVDQDGRPITNNQFEGKFMLIYFGFTNCPDICPTELTKLSKALDILDQKGLLQHVQPIFVTVDPMRDSVEKVREYVRDFHPKLLGLTGTPDQIQDMCREYRVYMSKANEKLGEKDEDDYLVDHSIIFYLMDPRGEFDSHYGAAANELQMAEKIGDIVKKHFYPQPETKGWFDWLK
eukprot:TRINITY_DN2447_c0_g1_i1.p1 TRINITY_DN2447_c0_g1~~TRINITY_DN2447_c0_g1_i1.p1  ORF type:complete len:306 (-),score=110.04 TRINITY_DN2447_c0_g1_i1:49-966(-)